MTQLRGRSGCPEAARDAVVDAFDVREPPAHKTEFLRWIVEGKVALTGLAYPRCEYCGEGG